MEIKIPKVLKEIPLSEYHADFGTRQVVVWVNPSLKLVKLRRELEKQSWTAISKKDEKEADRLNGELNAWYAEIWSQGTDPEMHLSAEEVAQAFEASPDFVRWLIERTSALFLSQREQEKKA